MLTSNTVTTQFGIPLDAFTMKPPQRQQPLPSEKKLPKWHYVKSWQHFYQAIKRGEKLHDLRKNDREYNVGDILVLQEYDFATGRYTGESIQAEITYITDNRVPCAFSSAVLEKGYSILSLRLLVK